MLSLVPCLLIKATNRGDNGQQEKTEHEIGCRSQPLIQTIANVKEEKGGHPDNDPPSTHHQDWTEIMHLLKLGSLCFHDLFLLFQTFYTVLFLADQGFHRIDHRAGEKGDQDGVESKGANRFTGVHLRIFMFQRNDDQSTDNQGAQLEVREVARACRCIFREAESCR